MRFSSIFTGSIFLILSLISLHAENLGHRLGGDIFKPGNTIYSYQKLIDKFNNSPRIKLIEFDIQETYEKQLVVFHDISKIYRVVPKSKYNCRILKEILSRKEFKKITIHDLTLEQIRNLRLEHNATIPTLQEVLEKSVDLNIHYPIHIEIKRLYTDRAREKLIEILKQYNRQLKIELIAFRKNYKISFPFPDRWLREFDKLGIDFYQIDRYKYTSASKNRYVEYQTLWDKRFSINKKTGRYVEFSLDIPTVDVNNTILIGVFNGQDNSGDKGLNIKLLTKDNKYLFSEFSDNAYWQWFKVPSTQTKNLNIILEDLDTLFSGKHPGNGGRVKILLGKVEK